MDTELRDRERRLEIVKVEREIEDEKAAIAEKKALEKKFKKEYGRDWKKIVGAVGKIKPNREALQDMYALNPELRDLTRPPTLNNLRR